MSDECFWGPLPTAEEEEHLRCLDRNQSFAQVIAWYMAGRFPPDRLNMLLVNTWVNAEWPLSIAEHAGLNTGGIVRMFMHAGFVTDRPECPQPSEPIRVYRGCTEWRLTGFSWTTQPETARWFAKRCALFGQMSDPDDDGEPVIVATIVEPQYILGMVHKGRGEAEVIVNPFGIQTEELITLYDLETPDIPAEVTKLERRKKKLERLSAAEQTDFYTRMMNADDIELSQVLCQLDSKN